jgi:xylulose-5-phosphate/fructose-6-phosphate phosphoketolase
VVLNGMSRYHLARSAIKRAVRFGSVADTYVDQLDELIRQSTAYAYQHFADPPEIADWTWTPRRSES